MTCPACQAETSLEVLLGREVDARAVAGFIERRVVFGELLVRYIALFRPGKRRLGISRMVVLIEELLPDIERGAINRKGRDWAAPRDSWRAALETVLLKRDKGDLVLPLTSHGLLYEVLVGTAERYERRDETEREQRKRMSRPSGPVADAPRNLAALTADLVAAGPAPLPANFPAPAGPSRAALEIRARNEALQRARSERTTPETPPDTGAAP
ncbi:MAG: hypothetical protein Q8K45_21255 [Rubrivivax sp.]|nr:hypothetical protein [Rubrivivax sp.]